MIPDDPRDPLTRHRSLLVACGTSMEGGMTGTVKGESVQWTSLSRSLNTRPLRVFIMKSIISFIISISTTMCGKTVSEADGRLVSCCSSLLGVLLPSGPSWFLLSALVPS